MSELFTRSPQNPLLSAADWPQPANAVFNPAAATVGGETVLLCRVEDRRGISHLTVARSRDGAGDWRIDEEPLIGPDVHGQDSCWGVEDPRTTYVSDLAAWVITYTAYGPSGTGIALALTTDFTEIEHLGIHLAPEDKNASLLSEPVDGEYVLLHRPASAHSGRSEVWASRSPDLRTWREPELVMRARSGAWWDTVRIGIGPPPLRTPYGWLALYHGVKHLAGALLYRVGVVLLDLEQPTVVLRRGEQWVLGPSEPYERTGDAPNVVFPTGLLHDPVEDRLRLYYGAADSYVAMATGSCSQLLEYALSCPPPP